MYDVAVVGGGPAGSSAALALAQEGLRVALVEKAPLPRGKTCGGGVVGRALRLLQTDVGEAIERECRSIEITLLGPGLRLSVSRAEPIISTTMRDKFDFILVSAAEDAGATLLSDCKVLDIGFHEDGVELLTTRDKLFARFVVAADGALSLVAQKAGWNETRTLIPAHEYRIFVNHYMLNRFSRSPRFDIDAAPWGYAWVFPKKDHLSVGMLSMRRSKFNVKESLDHYLKLIGIDDIKDTMHHTYFIPLSPRTDAFVKRRVLLAGDAAGFADPLVGEGITFAIKSGQLVARALLDAGLEEKRVREVYESELSHNLLPELRLSRFLAKLVYDCPGLRNWLFGLHGQKFAEGLTDVFMGERTYREILYNPLSYLKLLRV